MRSASSRGKALFATKSRLPGTPAADQEHVVTFAICERRSLCLLCFRRSANVSDWSAANRSVPRAAAAISGGIEARALLFPIPVGTSIIFAGNSLVFLFRNVELIVAIW